MFHLFIYDFSCNNLHSHIFMILYNITFELQTHTTNNNLLGYFILRCGDVSRMTCETQPHFKKPRRVTETQAETRVSSLESVSCCDTSAARWTWSQNIILNQIQISCFVWNKCQYVRPSSDTSYFVIGSLELKVSKNHYLALDLGKRKDVLLFENGVEICLNIVNVD